MAQPLLAVDGPDVDLQPQSFGILQPFGMLLEGSQMIVDSRQPHRLDFLWFDFAPQEGYHCLGILLMYVLAGMNAEGDVVRAILQPEFPYQLHGHVYQSAFPLRRAVGLDFHYQPAILPSYGFLQILLQGRQVLPVVEAMVH